MQNIPRRGLYTRFGYSRGHTHIKRGEAVRTVNIYFGTEAVNLTKKQKKKHNGGHSRDVTVHSVITAASTFVMGCVSPSFFHPSMHHLQ